MFVLQGTYKLRAPLISFSTGDVYKNTRLLCHTPRVKSLLNGPRSVVHSLDFSRLSPIECLTAVSSWIDQTASKSLTKTVFLQKQAFVGYSKVLQILKWQSYGIVRDAKSCFWVIFSLCKTWPRRGGHAPC